MRFDFSCESSAQLRIHLKHQVLFSLKDNEKIFLYVVCCSRDWSFKGKSSKKRKKDEFANSIRQLMMPGYTLFHLSFWLFSILQLGLHFFEILQT